METPGLSMGKTVELVGHNQKWRLWHTASCGYMSGREWKIGPAIIYIIQTQDDEITHMYDFECGREWKRGRKLLAEIVDKLNALPTTPVEMFPPVHQPLRELVKTVMEYDPAQTPVQRLQRILDEGWTP